MATHSCILAWRIPWTEEPGRLQPTGSHRAVGSEGYARETAGPRGPPGRAPDSTPAPGGSAWLMRLCFLCAVNQVHRTICFWKSSSLTSTIIPKIRFPPTFVMTLKLPTLPKSEGKPEGQRDGVKCRKKETPREKERKLGPKNAFLTIPSSI